MTRTCFPFSLLSFSCHNSSFLLSTPPQISGFSAPFFHFSSLQPHDFLLLHFDSAVSLPITISSHTINYSHPISKLSKTFAVYLHASAYQPFSGITVPIQPHFFTFPVPFSNFQFHNCISLSSLLHFSGFSFVSASQTVLISWHDSAFPFTLSHNEHQSMPGTRFCTTFCDGDRTDLLKQ